jgi:hypothetical protein
MSCPTKSEGDLLLYVIMTKMSDGTVMIIFILPRCVLHFLGKKADKIPMYCSLIYRKQDKKISLEVVIVTQIYEDLPFSFFISAIVLR